MWSRWVLLVGIAIQLADGKENSTNSNGKTFSFTLNKRDKFDFMMFFIHKFEAATTHYTKMIQNPYSANAVFSAEITIGRPGQVFKVVMDTGSGALWVPMRGCRHQGDMGEYCKKKRSLYDPSRSSTAQRTGTSFKLSYGIGYAHCDVYKDYFAFGGGNGPKLEFKNPVEFGGGKKLRDGDQGILGLSYLQDYDKGTSIFGRAVEEGLFTKNMFTVFLKQCNGGHSECADAGVITMGGEDTTNCGPVQAWAKVGHSAKHWEFRVSEVRARHYRYAKRLHAMTDTGSSHIFMPRWLAESVARGLGAKGSPDGWMVSCNRKFNLRFRISGRQFNIPAKELTKKIRGNDCELLIAIGGGSTIILGDPWIRAFCQIHDWTGHRVGFALPRSRMG